MSNVDLIVVVGGGMGSGSFIYCSKLICLMKDSKTGLCTFMKPWMDVLVMGVTPEEVLSGPNFLLEL